ncbi:Mariner Mos1 transposase [Formica fusca]
MSVYEPNSRHLREVLIFCFNMKKSAAEAHRMHSNTYGEAAISERRCREWFQRFKNGDFHVDDWHSGGREKVLEDAELEALLNEDLSQSQEELARSLGVTQQAISKRLKDMGMIQKQGNWVPYEL